MAGVVEGMPNRHSFGWKTTIGEGNNQRRARMHHPAHLAEHRDWISQVLDRDTNGGAVELHRLEWQVRLRIHVLYHEGVKARVGGKLLLIQPEPDNSTIAGLDRQVADPATHPVENATVGRKQLAIQLGDRGYGRVIDVLHKTRLVVKERVCRLVVAAEGLG